MASAGISMRAVSENRSLTRAAPSSMEYSVCTCRCTKESLMLSLQGAGELRPALWCPGKTRPTYVSCLTPLHDILRRVATGVSEKYGDPYRAGHQHGDGDDQRGPDAVDVGRLAGIDRAVHEVLLERREI